MNRTKKNGVAISIQQAIFTGNAQQLQQLPERFMLQITIFPMVPLSQPSPHDIVQPRQAAHGRSFGFFRRQIILEARERNPDRKDNPYLAESLCTEKEGIFLWALEGLQRLVRNDFRFTVRSEIRILILVKGLIFTP